MYLLVVNPKKMAMHASECVQEMQKACDKLLGTKQLIRSDATMQNTEKQALLIAVDKAISNFRSRLESVLSGYSNK